MFRNDYFAYIIFGIAVIYTVWFSHKMIKKGIREPRGFLESMMYYSLKPFLDDDGRLRLSRREIFFLGLLLFLIVFTPFIDYWLYH